jgi:GH15 family glucan-1,4-alpha-glucosidase
VAVPLAVAALVGTCAAPSPSASGPPSWRSPGLVGPYGLNALDPALSPGASYLYDSSVVRLSDGRVLLVPLGSSDPVETTQDDPRVTAALDADADWLDAGTIPGTTADQRAMGARALLDLRLLTAPNGANVASWYGNWAYVWPRDAAFTAAAFTVAGHAGDAVRVLRFLAQAQDSDGLWAARYRPDGTAVDDGRTVQLDGLGWALWATWLVATTDRRGGDADLAGLWPMVRRAADKVAGLLGREGLPPRSSDYFERKPSDEQSPRDPTLGVIAPLLTGMRAAAALARRHGGRAETARWTTAAERLQHAVDTYFKPYGYPRSPVRHGVMDASPTFLAPPFAPPDPSVNSAVLRAERTLALPSGGVLPSADWPGNRTQAWTPETAMFALAAAASGRDRDAISLLGWLQDHRTSLGALPEKVDSRGRQASVAPLGWTCALTVLALDAQSQAIPMPPANGS